MVQLRFYILLNVICVLFVACAPMGRRLLNVEIVQNGKVIAAGITDDEGTQGPDQILKGLGKVVFKVEINGKEPDGSWAGVIPGEMTIKVNHTEKLVAEIVVSDLKLTRASTENKRYKIPKDELQRILKK